MTTSFYEPPALEVGLTLGLGLTLLSPYYRRFARTLNLRGDERVMDFGSGSGICTRHIAAVYKRAGTWIASTFLTTGCGSSVRPCDVTTT